MNGNINRLFYFCKRKEVKKLGIRIWEVGFRISDLGFGISDLGFRIWDLGKSKVRKLLMLAACSLPLTAYRLLQTANCKLLTAYRLPLTTNSLFYD